MLHYSAQFCNALAEKYQVSVVLADYYQGNLYDPNINIVKIKTNPDVKSFIFESLDIVQHIKLRKTIKKLKPDIIHFIDNHPRYILYAKWLKRAGYPIYVTQHDPTLHSGDSKWLQGKVAVWTNSVLREISDKLIVHWENLKAELVEHYQVKAEKITVVPHGNYNFFTRWWKKNANPIQNSFLFFGRIVEYKWLDILLKSLVFILKKVPNFTLIIAWSWSLDTYKELLDTYASHIKVYNINIPDEEVRRYFQMVEFVVLPYKDATGSGVIPLAFAFKKPVLVNNVGELGNYTRDAQGGYVMNTLTPQVLAEQIIYLLEHKKEAQQLGQNGRNYTEEVLWWAGIVAKIYS